MEPYWVSSTLWHVEEWDRDKEPCKSETILINNILIKSKKYRNTEGEKLSEV